MINFKKIAAGALIASVIFFFTGVVIAATITTIAGTDTISSSRTTINDNFTNLNNGKLEDTGDTAADLSVGTLTVGSLSATSTSATSTFPFDLYANGLLAGTFIETPLIFATSTSATSTIYGLNVTGALREQNLVSCDSVDTDSNGFFVCGTDDTGSGVWAQYNGVGIKTVTAGDTVVIGGTASTTDDQFEVHGDASIQGNLDVNSIDATSTSVASTFLGGILVTASSTVDSTLTVTGALNGVSSLGATAESTVEAAIDTLANLTSIQGLTVTLADAGADAIFGWNDGDGEYKNLSAAEVLAIVGGAANDFDGSGDVTDLSCTDCINATEIEDIYLLNNGDAGTGTFDFGGADDFEIPNGSDPTVDTSGQIAVDTSATSTLNYHDGTAERVISAFKKISFLITTPASLTVADYPLENLSTGGWTIHQIECITDPEDTTGVEMPLDFWEGDSSADATTTIDGTFTCDNDGAADDGSLTNSTLDIGDWFGFTPGTASGTPNGVTVTITYVENP